MSKGYMRISRDKLSSWCWRGNMNKNYLMMFLLVNANFKSERFEKIIVERGQYIFSYDGLSRDCGMPLQTLRTTLKDLVETNQITIKSTRKWSLLTICEYDSWQNQDDETNTQVVTQTGTQVVTQMDNNIINKEIDNKDIKEEESIDSKKKDGELISRLSEMEKEIESLEEENKKLKEEKEKREKKKSCNFIPPTIEEVDAYITEKGFHFTAEAWMDHYSSVGWMVGKNKMKDWKAACRTWENGRREKSEDPITRRIDKSVPEFKRFAEWVDEYYPMIRDMEMPDEQKYNEMKKMVNGDFMWACDNLQDDYHTGSLYDLFKERFGSN